MITPERFLARKDDDFEGWLEARRTGITATQVADASTQNGFERAKADIFLRPEPVDNAYMKFGRDWEGHMAEHVEAEYGVAPNEWLIRAEEQEHHLATPDGLSADHLTIGEYKTTGKDWGSVEKLPIRYKRQIQWQLHVTGAERCVVAWLLREQVEDEFVPAWFRPKTGIIERDEDAIKRLIEVADTLWVETKEMRD